MVLRRRVPRLARLVALAAAAVVTGLSFATPAQAVANGTPVPEGRYRFAVKLTMTDIPRPDGSHYDSACSAGLVSPWWIITAGHCFHDVNRNPISGPVPYATTATVGRADLSHDHLGHVVDVVSVQQSPSNDIALAKLARPVYDVAPLRLPQKAPQAGDVLRIAGWGALSDVDAKPATHLQTGQFKVASVAATTVGVQGYRPDPDTSACLYDSGAPYFAEHGPIAVLVSVESNGPACPHAQVETTARVDGLTGWIRTTIR
ncbi:trypsin-like serine protease [Dactylosporangium sp. CA-092794]|uniref:trypsin-like serine protease n=1 Tax=Dactylosporangium sp. CA-092794 TaxID=3239929 RepID=UPI003D8A8A2E